MSKVASYLQEHIQGRVSTNTAVLQAASTDGSLLTVVPEMVIYPKVTSDIRKVARFAWQLAEKGHVLSLTARGYGGDRTGAAIGKGAVIVLPAFMNTIFEFDNKQKLVRVQPGVDVSTLNAALSLQGAGVPAFIGLPGASTVGGVVANNTHGPLSGRYGDSHNWVSQLEIVLATGEILQTGRISKRDLNKKKGQQDFEGEIYRTIDGLIEDNQQLIEERIATDTPDNGGYASIAKVKRKDGSFDLTPLFIGSQGTLGIISEMILRTEFLSSSKSAAVATFSSVEAARDAIDQLVRLEPTYLEYFDNAFFTIAAAHGKTYDFYKNADAPVKAVVLVGFDDFNERANRKKLKKVAKLLSNPEVQVTIADGDDADDIISTREVVSYLLTPSEKELSAPALFDGVYIPNEQYMTFAKGIGEIAKKHEVVLPLYRRELDETVFTRPLLRLQKISDKQKMFKIMDDVAALVNKCGGNFVAQDAEGRLKTHFLHDYLDDDVVAVYTSVKQAFDPYGILNADVKQYTPVRTISTLLRRDLGAISSVGTDSTY